MLVAVPDDAIGHVARRLADDEGITRAQTVLHLSGLLDRRALSVLDPTGAALGSFHPLQTIAAPGSAGERLRGAYAAIEGDSRAIEMAERLATTLRMAPIILSAESKPLYHAAAAMVANYGVTLVAMAARLAGRAGVPAADASRLFLPLLKGAVENLAELEPAEALTGPIRRGDVETVTAHLAALEPDERQVYTLLGREALRLAREAGLEADRADPVERALEAAAGGDAPAKPAKAAKAKAAKR